MLKSRLFLYLCSSCERCKIAKFTLDNASYLNLKSATNIILGVGSPQMSNESCGGELKSLTAKGGNVFVCVLSDSRNSNSSNSRGSNSNSSNLKSSNIGLIAGISAAAVVVIIILIVFFVWRKKKVAGGSGHSKYTECTDSTQERTIQKSNLDMQVNIDGCLIYRLDEEQLHHTKVIAKGASGEVSLGKYKSRTVAIKRMLYSRGDLKDIQRMIKEIELMGR